MSAISPRGLKAGFQSLIAVDRDDEVTVTITSGGILSVEHAEDGVITIATTLVGAVLKQPIHSVCNVNAVASSI